MNSLKDSLIRTYVPIIVGALFSYFASIGLELDAETQHGFIIALTGILQGLYYLVARLIEQKYPAKGGLLLGSPKVPVYKKVTKE